MLSPQEKVAGRKFRDDAQAVLLASFEDNAPTYVVPNFLALYRHKCFKREGRSTALELKEMYLWSPAYTILNTDPMIVCAEGEQPAPQVVPAGDHVMTWIPPGRFGFVWKAGVCRGCGQTARSRAGRIVDSYQRPPLHGRVARS